MNSEKILNIRKKNGWTQEQLAEMIGISRSFLSEIETGKRGLHYEKIPALASALGVPISELLSAEPVDTETVRLLASFSLLSDEDRGAVLNHAEALARVAEIGRLLK